MASVQELQKERNQIFKDVHNSVIPKRVPINSAVSLDVTAKFGGIDIVEAKWTPSKVEEAADKLCQVLYSDVCPFSGTLRYPSFYQVLDAQSFVMSSTGIIQHPEVVGMEVEDYDYLIEKPLDCIIERVLPRQYKALDLNNPMGTALTLMMSQVVRDRDFMEAGAIRRKLTEKYGYYAGPPGTAKGFTEAPLDFLADLLRGFRQISMDIRRIPDKVEAAVEALYPILLEKGMPINPTEDSVVSFPLHMPPFMREKDFARLWWPTFKRMVDEYASLGIHVSIFCEGDWTRYLDYLAELPVNTEIRFEYGDPKLIKEKLGNRHIITGLYPVTLLKEGTKEECIAKADELLNILAPGGKYIFNLEKSPVDFNDFKLENYCAVTEYIREHGVYTNAGERSGAVFKKEDYKAQPSRKLESKYLKDWELFKSKYPVTEQGLVKMQKTEKTVLQFILDLLL